jgi:hypothetical protein
MSYDYYSGAQEIVGGPDEETGAEYEYAGGPDYAELSQYTAGAAALPPARPGPPPRHAPPMMVPRNRPVAYADDPRGQRVVDRPATKPRQFPIGFIKDVAGGEEDNITVDAQVLFRGERLAVAPSIAAGFHIVDIKVGKNSQLAATGEMPAESFAADAVGVRMELDTAQPGLAITLRVRNLSLERATFKAVLYGSVVEP